MAILPGTRIRDNGITGTLIDNPLSSTAIVINSANLFRLSVVSGNHAIITLDPLRQFGEPEIVMVTAHSAGATAATVQRGMYGTVPRAHPINTLWVHAATNDDFELVSTSGSRPSDVWRGQTIYETDTARTMRFTGATWVQDGLNFDPPACKLANNVNIPITHNTETVLTWNTELLDTDAMHDPSVFPGRITVKTPGIYLIIASVGWGTVAGLGERDTMIYVNGARQALHVELMAAANGYAYNSTSMIYKATTNDYFELRVYQNSGSSVDSLNNQGVPRFEAIWMGRGN